MTTTAPAFQPQSARNIPLESLFPLADLHLPKRLPPVAWCAENVHLGNDITRPRWDPDAAPHAKAVLEAFAAPHVRKIAMCWASQTGKTTTEVCCLAYSRANGRAFPVMWATDQVDTLKDVTIPALTPVFTAPNLAGYLKPGKRSIHMRGVEFRRGRMSFAIAESEGKLSGRPCGLVICDEIDKWPASTKNEGNPLDQAEARMRSFGSRGKMLLASTPTTSFGNMWTMRDLFTVFEWAVVDPGSGVLHPWDIDRVHWTPKQTGESDRDFYIRATRGGDVQFWYEHPSGHISRTEYERRQLNKGGAYIQTQEGPASDLFFHANALAGWSDSVSFRAVAIEWLKCLAAKEAGDPEPTKNFFIHWRAEPPDIGETRVEFEELAKLERPVERGKVIESTTILTTGQDVQHAGTWFVELCVYGTEMPPRVHVVDCGYIAGPVEISTPNLVQQAGMRVPSITDPTTGITRPALHLLGADCGDGQMELRVFAATNVHPNLSIPVRGSDASHTNGRPFQFTPKKKGPNGAYLADQGPDGGRTLTIDVGRIKDLLRDEITRARLTFFAGASSDPNLFPHMTSEERTVKRNSRGKRQSVWAPKPGVAANHLWDCLVYARALAWLLNIPGQEAGLGMGNRPQATVSTGPRRRGSPGWGGGLYK